MTAADDLLRATAEALWNDGAWAGECCDHLDYDGCQDCQRVCESYARAALAVALPVVAAHLDDALGDLASREVRALIPEA